MKKICLTLVLAISSTYSFAGLPEMMNTYNNPKTAPNVSECKGDIYCNGFIALSKQWRDIPDSYRYEGAHDIKYYAKRGWTYDDQGRNRGLSMGFGWSADRSNRFIEGAEYYTDNRGYIPDHYEGGLAVLLYIEDKNGWTK